MGNSLAPEEKRLIDATKFSAKELSDLKKHFVRVKGAKSMEDELTLREFVSVFEELFAASIDESIDMEGIFASVDADHNGRVSFREFALWLSVYSRGTVEEKLRHMFALFDWNGNGSVEEKELETLMTVLRHAMQIKIARERQLQRGEIDMEAVNEANRIVSLLDRDHDGKITLDEWLDVGKKVGLVELLLGQKFQNMLQQGAVSKKAASK